MPLVGHIERSQVQRALAWGAIVAQVIFVAGWVLLGAIEGHGYSAARHDISDLGALTAHHVVPNLTTLGVSGLITMAFALFALRPLLGGLGPWLVALSLPSLDNLSDTFFRLDCRAADRGCSASVASASWHGTIHVMVALVAGIATIAAPFVLSRRMRAVDGWRDLAIPTRNFGVAFVLIIIAVLVSQSTSLQGATQRLAAVFVCAGIAVLAWRVIVLTRSRVEQPAV